MTVIERPLRGKVELERIPTWGDVYNREANPTALSTLDTSPFIARYGWTRTFVTTGSPPPDLPFATVARITSTQTGTLSGRGFDSYGSPDAATPGTTGGWIASPVVIPGEVITVSRYMHFGGLSTRWRVRVRFHDGAGNWIGSSIDGPFTGTSNTWRRPYVTATVPAGAKYMAIHTTNVDAVAVTTSTIMSMTGIVIQAGPMPGAINIDDVTGLTIQRGGARSGLGIKTDVGLMSFNLRNAEDPMNGGSFVPGQVIRAKAGSGTLAPIFTGRIVDVSSTYPLNKANGVKSTSVTITVADAVYIHNSTPRSGALVGPPYYETFEARINRLKASAEAPIDVPVVGAPIVKYGF